MGGIRNGAAAGLAGLLLALVESARAQVHEGFDDQVDVPPLTRLDPVGLLCACGPRATFGFVDLGGGDFAYRMQADASVIGHNGFGPSRALSHLGAATPTDFYAATDYLEWTGAAGTIASRHGIGAFREVGPGSTDGYALVHDYPTSGGGQSVALVRYDDESPTTLAATPVALDAGKDYRLLIWREGATLRGEVREMPSLSRVVDLTATGASWAGLAPGLVVTGANYDDLPNALFDDFHGGPLDADSDSDGLADRFELRHGFDPLDPDENGNGRPDGMDDSDADGLGNAAEAAAGTSPVVADSDADGLLDGAELGTGTFDPQQRISPVDYVKTAVFAADMDGDGDTDVVGASSDSRIIWHENTDGQGSFTPERLISTAAYGPQSVVAADVDGDGDQDVLSASEMDDEIAWYENTDGLGTFGPQKVISNSADAARSVFAADLDGDSDLDVLSASRNDHEIAWYENTDGLGTFGPQHVITTAAAYAASVFAADLDRDGDTDVLSASELDDEIAWYENVDGLGAFGPQQVLSTAANGARSVFAADLDGDFDLDVLSASSLDHKIAWYENTDGLGAFGAQQVISTTASGARSVFAVDVDADGDTDVLSALGYASEIAWYENASGTGTFGPPRTIAFAPDGTNSVFAADLDSDGDADVLSTLIGWFEQRNAADPLDSDSDDDGLGDGAEVSAHGTDPLMLDTDGDGLSDGVEVNDLGTDPLEVDTDGDGLSDSFEVQAGIDPLAVDSDADGLLDGFEVAHGFAPLVPGEQTQDPDADLLSNLEEQSSGTSPLVADTDGDGLFDGSEVHSHGTDPLRSDTDGDTLRDAFELDIGFDPTDADQDGNGRPDGMDDADADGLGNAAEQAAGTDAVDADTDGDGLPDGVEIGTGTFGAQRLISAAADGAISVFAADVDGDGDTDALSASHWGDEIDWYENTDGEGTFGAPRVMAEIVNPRFVLGADVDGDGDTDALVAAEFDLNIVWLENTDGRGAFGAPRVLPTGDGNPTALFAVDVDADGDTDVLSATTDDLITWHENQDGRGEFGAAQVISTATRDPASVFGADLDGDGDTDVLSAGTRDDEIARYENTDGQGTFGTKQVISTAADGAYSVFAADVDGDGDMDVVSTSGIDDEIAWYENADGAFGPQQVISLTTNGPESMVATDVDGDGDTDVLSASRWDDEIVWYANTDGQGTFGPQQVISTEADAPVSVFAADVDGDGDADVLSASRNDDEVAWYEQTNVADPLDPDSDDDGLVDGAEANTHGTNPTLADTDGDGWSDGEEIAAGSDPLDPGSTPTPPQVPTAGALGRALLAFGMLLAGVRAMRAGGRRAAL